MALRKASELLFHLGLQGVEAACQAITEKMSDLQIKEHGKIISYFPIIGSGSQTCGKEMAKLEMVLGIKQARS